MQNNEPSKAEILANELVNYTHDPLGHALFSYPWEEQGTPLAHHTGPRKWQRQILNDIGDHLQNAETRHQPLQIAVASGHGIGKSALIGMIINWALDTCEDTRIVCTANTDGQLKTKTAPEVAKWSRLKIASEFFTVIATSIFCNAKEHIKSWRCDFSPWSKDNSEAFAGLHNEGKRIVVIYDEASGIDDIIWEVTEGALTDENTEIIWIAFGNPTRNMGRFRECFRKFSKFWITYKIDSRTVEGTNNKLFDKWAEAYGEDSDFFKVRVRGEFPSMSANQFISTDVADRQKGVHLKPHQYDFAPVVITCDPAWTGDDSILIGKRQGLVFEILEKIPKNDNDVLIANKLARYEQKFNADMVFIDGGFGTGIYSAGKTMGRVWRLVWFNEKSIRNDCVNKRAEMYVNAKEWLDEGGVFPDDDELYEEMLAVETMATMDGKYKFAPKDSMKEILGRSPNCWDALVLSFAFPVAKKAKGLKGQRNKTHKTAHEYDPFANRDESGVTDHDYDPFA